MCEPSTTVGLIASLIGTGASVASSQIEKGNMNDAAKAELMRQQDYAKQGQNVFEQSLSQSTPDAVKSQMDKGSQQALQEYTKLQNGNQLPQLANANAQINPSKQYNATEDTLVGAKTGASNTANAVLQGYNSSDVLQGIKNLQARSQLGQIGSFSNASSSVLPLELQAAQGSASGLAGIGSLLQSSGGLASTYGAVNKPATSNFNFANHLQTSPQIPFNDTYLNSIFNSPFNTVPYLR